MACEDQINTEDLTNAKLDAITLGEVATSKAGAESTGAAITQSTNRLGETTDTIQGRLNKLGVIYDDPIKDWSASLLVSDLRAHRYPATTGDVYIPVKPLPFTTGATFNTNDWILNSSYQEGAVEAQILNDLAITYNFKTIAEYKAFTTEFPIGKKVYIEERNANFTVIAGTGTATNYKIVDSDEVNQSIDLIVSWSPSIVEFGAVGGNATVDSGALNAALSIRNDVTIPQIGTPFIFSNIQLPRGAWLQGTEKYDGGTGTATTFIGDGSNPVFLCGDGGTTPLREHTFRQLGGDGNGQSVIYGRTAPNLDIQECFFLTNSATNHTVDLELCVRSSITRNRIANSGGGWAIQGMDNMNASDIQYNILTGGSSGGALNIGRTQVLNAQGNRIESSLKGVYVGSDSNPSNGNCSGINLDGTYIENCSSPFVFGEVFTVQTLSAQNCYIGNTSMTTTPDSMFKLGRIKDSKIKNNKLNVNVGETVYEMYLNQATGDQEGNEFGASTDIFGTPLNVYSLTGAFGSSGSVLRTVGWQNYYPFLSALSKRDEVVFESGTISANTGLATSAFNDYTVLGLGGKVTKIEVFEKQGTITSTLTVGRASSGAELLNINPESLTFDNGRATATLATTSATMRTTEASTYRVIAGAGTGTFRVRITYRVS